jgi:hypothetical protein
VRKPFRILSGLAKFAVGCALVWFSLMFCLDTEDWNTLSRIAWGDLLKILLAAQLVYALSGIEFAIIVYFNSRVRLSLVDIFFLPITMNLWSFLIPFQGALVYSSLILKCKYKTRLSEAVATSIFSYFLSIVITGVFGVCFSALVGSWLSPWMVASTLLALFPFMLFGVEKIVAWMPTIRIRILKSALSFVHEIVVRIRALFSMPRLLGLLFLTNISHIAASFLMNYYAAVALNVIVSWQILLVFTLLIRLSVILKVTPGNVGVQEILSGGIFSLMMLDPAAGILITLLTRLVTVSQMCTVGVVDTISNTKYFSLRSVFSYRNALSRS